MAVFGGRRLLPSLPPRRSRQLPSATAGSVFSYHGQPVLKEPVWTWEIPAYFFPVGGMAGASAGLAFSLGLRGNEVLARRAWTGRVRW